MPYRDWQPGLTTGEVGRAISRMTVTGLKSIHGAIDLEIRPLTLLAGANSSGKSTFMQGALLLKQTLEAAYDPGPLLLGGPNVRLTSTQQLFSSIGEHHGCAAIEIGVSCGPDVFVMMRFAKGASEPIELVKMVYLAKDQLVTIAPTTVPPPEWRANVARSSAERERCFFHAVYDYGDGSRGWTQPGYAIELPLRAIIHVPGLRGNPERLYPIGAVAATYPGTFEKYVASVLRRWHTPNPTPPMQGVCNDLRRLGLTHTIIAQPISDTEVSIAVGRLPQRDSAVGDLVNIADVGFGVSQVLPVVVALHAAQPGQMVYIEQPELHLHPAAQIALGEVLADAAKRGVIVVAETHSAALLLAVQTLVAEGKLPTELVKLHWFQRGTDGATTVRSADLDDAGAFGDWPEDFGRTELDLESRYLDAVEARRAKE